ncbi:MAG: 50S ribosomal protein L25 [Candidatus Portnoybacteria bacterium]|nr:50S ribosomal protein L25 [Candidatus Portnoybacteria bacterium]
MLELLVKMREGTGRKNEKIREQGFVPAVLYGREVENLLLAVDEQDFKKIYEKAGASALVKLKIDNGGKEDERVVLIQDAAKDVVSGKVIHIDFNQIKMDEETEVEIPLVFIGESMAVKSEGGVLVKNIQSIEVKALPQNLPKEIEVDISIIKTFNDNIRLKDLKIPENVKVTANLEEIIASVVPPRTSAELEGLEQTPTESVEEVEVEKKGKEKKEEGQEGGDVSGGGNE